MDDLSDAIAAIGSGTTYAVKRASAAVSDGMGRFTEGSTSTFRISAVVHPVSGRELDRLPEGLRQRELRVVFTGTELRTAGGGKGADRVVIDGSDWEVQKVESWRELGNYFRAVVAWIGS